MLNFIYQNKQNSCYANICRVKYHTSVKIGNPGEYMNCKWRYDFISALGKDGIPV
jgi:hypothetical protein